MVLHRPVEPAPCIRTYPKMRVWERRGRTVPSTRQNDSEKLPLRSNFRLASGSTIVQLAFPLSRRPICQRT